MLRSLTFALLVGACVWSLALADDGAIEAVGGTISPMSEHPTIEMSAEFVHAWVSPDSVRVECVFIMHNRGPATRVLVGFPCTSDGVEVSTATPFRWFRSWVDGEPVRTKVMNDTSSADRSEWARSWWVKTVPFAAGETHCMRDEYTAEPGFSEMDERWFEYTLRSGATWAGTIGSADIVVTLERLDGMTISSRPAPTSRGPRELRWHFANLKPGRDGAPNDLFVDWHPPNALDSLTEEPPDTLVANPTPMTGLGVDHLPPGLTLANEAHRFAPGVTGWQVLQHPGLWAIEYRWEFVRSGVAPGWYAPARLLALGDSLGVSETNTLAVLDCGATLRVGITAADSVQARLEALRQRPTTLPPDLELAMRPILRHALIEYEHARARNDVK